MEIPGNDLCAIDELVHPEQEQIIAQVEYYFGDENLPRDAHLLALTGGDGNGKVRTRTILGFPKMRRFKPKSQVVAALRQSHLVEIIDDQWIRRKQPLSVPLQVEPKLSDPFARQKVASEDRPWLTKGMLKPTGFEPGFVEGPMTPAQFAEERELYSSDQSFVSRIEEAINRFCRNRKMHQTTRNIFVKFMSFGGVEGGQGQFGSGTNKRQLKKEGYDADEIDRLLAYFSVKNAVLDEFNEADANSGTYHVDFELLAKGFLSSRFMKSFDWTNEELIATACNVLRNFYNYLLYHDVCPEYHQQLLSARTVCDVAEDQLTRLIAVENGLPGSFNVACSTLHDGCYAGLYRQPGAAWHVEVDNTNIGYSSEQALVHLRAGVDAYGTDKQKNILETEQREGRGTGFHLAYEEDVGLEIIRAVKMTDVAATIYTGDRSEAQSLKPVGLLVCKRWNIPYERQACTLAIPISTFPSHYEFTFLVEQSILDKVVPGMKLDAKVKQFDNGIVWIDQLYAAHPSYFTWLGNELIGKKKEKRKVAMHENLSPDESGQEEIAGEDAGEDVGEGSDGDDLDTEASE